VCGEKKASVLNLMGFLYLLLYPGPRVKDLGGGFSNLFLQNFELRACFNLSDSVT
jgi:hypothetical protein